MNLLFAATSPPHIFSLILKKSVTPSWQKVEGIYPHTSVATPLANIENNTMNML